MKQKNTIHAKLLRNEEFRIDVLAEMKISDLQRKYGNGYNTIKRAAEAIRDAKPETSETHTFTENGNVHHVSLISEVRTLEQLIEKLEINTDIWAVESFRVGKWDSQAKVKKGDEEIVQVTPLYQVSAKLVRRKNVELALDSLDSVLEAIKNNSRVIKRKRYKNALKGNLQEISIFDLHVGKLAWKEEVGSDYDSDIACELFRKAIDYHIKYGELYQPERYLLPLGNDFFNIDNGANTTTAGTFQDVDTRWKRMFKMGRELLVETIELLTQFAPVDVLIIPGNHDTETSWHLGESLACWFHNNENVMIDNSPKLRKLYTYGDNVIGFTHGNREKVKDLPLIFQTEFGLQWGSAKWREIHHGHYHNKRIC